MAIISLVTFLLRLCLWTTDPPSQVQFDGGQSRKPEQHLGLGHVFPSFHCQVLPIDLQLVSSFCLGERVDPSSWSQPQKLHAPPFTSASHLPSHVQLAPPQAPQGPEPPLNIVRGEDWADGEDPGDDGILSHPDLGSGAALGTSQAVHSFCAYRTRWRQLPKR